MLSMAIIEEQAAIELPARELLARNNRVNRIKNRTRRQLAIGEGSDNCSRVGGDRNDCSTNANNDNDSNRNSQENENRSRRR